MEIKPRSLLKLGQHFHYFRTDVRSQACFLMLALLACVCHVEGEK